MSHLQRSICLEFIMVALSHYPGFCRTFGANQSKQPYPQSEGVGLFLSFVEAAGITTTNTRRAYLLIYFFPFWMKSFPEGSEPRRTPSIPKIFEESAVAVVFLIAVVVELVATASAAISYIYMS